MIETAPLWLTLQLALATTALLLLLGIPIAYGLSVSRSPFKPFAEALISLPLVLPPTVLGFYFLIAFSPNSLFGGWVQKYLNINLLFSFEGLVIASVIYSLPFMVNPVLSGLRNLPLQMKEASATLGKSGLTTFFQVLLPNIKPSLLTAIILTFAHTVGEFGVVLMIGGSIPGKTKVASIMIYDQVESMHYESAHRYAIILLVASFIILSVTYYFNRKDKSKLLP